MCELLFLVVGGGMVVYVRAVGVWKSPVVEGDVTSGCAKRRRFVWTRLTIDAAVVKQHLGRLAGRRRYLDDVLVAAAGAGAAERSLHGEGAMEARWQPGGGRRSLEAESGKPVYDGTRLGCLAGWRWGGNEMGMREDGMGMREDGMGSSGRG